MPGIIRLPSPPIESNSLESENKYVASAHRAYIAQQVLEQLCDPDPKFPVGIVCSIYYDSRNWDMLREKRDSDYLKTKIRLRWYENSKETSFETDPSFAEAKYRVGSKRTKIRVTSKMTGEYLSKISLDDPELLAVPSLLAAQGAPVRRGLFPTFVVRYCRRRYVDRATNVRVSLDYQITSPKVNSSMLAQTQPCHLRKCVLEVKGTDGLFPVSLNCLLKLGFRKTAFSKYYECYSELTGTFF